MSNLVNAERVTMSYGTRTLLDGISLGLGPRRRGGRRGPQRSRKDHPAPGSRRNAGAGRGRVTHTGQLSIGFLHRLTTSQPTPPYAISSSAAHQTTSGRPILVRERSSNICLPMSTLMPKSLSLSGGERRRVALVKLLLADHDLLVLDEPTNHLDVEAVDWLAKHLNDLQAADVAMLVVSHDRWFLDAVCTRIWEVHDGAVHAYDGGYAAYVLARAERVRQAASVAARRNNLLRKELAWLRRGPPARTSKPKFRLDAAAALIADEPEPRDRLQLQRFATPDWARTFSILTG